MLMGVGAAIDITRLSQAKTNLQDAIDTAALSGAVAYMQGDERDMNEQGRQVFNVNAARNQNLTIKNFDMKKQTGDLVYAEAEAKLQPMFMGAFGYPIMDIKVTSTATVGQSVGAEVALAVDTTNSMAFGSSWNDTMGTVENILEDMKSFSGDNNFYFTLVPFQDRVNIGEDRKNWVKTGHIKNSTDSFDDDWDDQWDNDDWDDDDDWEDDWDGCVEPRHEEVGDYDWMLTDAKPTSNKFLPTHEDAEMSDGRDLNWPKVSITGPTNDIDDVIKESKKLKKGGTGRYDVGLAWAWRAMSPEWRGKWGVSNYPAKYTQANNSTKPNDKIRKKYIVYMTDGRSNAFKLEAMKEESWGYNNGSKQAFEHIAELCETIKADGIEIYMLQIPGNSNATPYFESCASSPSHHIMVDEVEDISFAFNKIKTSLYAEVRTVN
jgi:Flp pilus assembly protein TadG